ncbi:hypothetical protein PT276_06645 [Orbaceae bacterium ESL0721]|nr:hypothetical protein [Orbaceae bacterium ESL0721]
MRNIMGEPERPLRNLASTMQIMGGAVNLYIAATIGATGVGTPLAATNTFVGLDNIQAGVVILLKIHHKLWCTIFRVGGTP